MGLILLLAFIGVPLIEIYLFIEIGGLIGTWPTIGIVVITALLGSAALRMQGLAVMNRARGQMDQGVLPARELFDGFCLVIAGALLLTPGFMTDAIGALLFIPPFRDFLRRRLAAYMETHGETVIIQDGKTVHRGPRRPAGPRPGTIEGEFHEVKDEEEPTEDIEPPAEPGRGWDRRDGAGGGKRGGSQ